MKRVFLLLAASSLVCAQGTTPKPKPTDYPVHSESEGTAIGVEYMVHSFGAGKEMYIIPDYLVVEVALYPPKGQTVTADLAQFSLRINGKKTLIPPQPPTVAAVSLTHATWRSERPGVTADAGVGGVGVGVGHPTTTAPFPGAPEPRRTPAPPRAPDAGPPGGIERPEPVKADQVLVQTALPADPHAGPISGFLFFPYTGKASSIKSLDLRWKDAVLKLR